MFEVRIPVPAGIELAIRSERDASAREPHLSFVAMRLGCMALC